MDNPDKRHAIVTYTNANAAELQRKQYELNNSPLPNLIIDTWFSFLLKHCIRPYQGALYSQRINEMLFVKGRSVPYVPENRLSQHYFSSPGQIYSDKIAKFANKLNRHANGRPIRRLERCFDHVMFDECQDLRAYDLDLIEVFLRANQSTTLVGDPRQATYATNSLSKYRQYAGRNIVKKFDEWQKIGLCELINQSHSYRCNQEICNFADKFYENERDLFPLTEARNDKVTAHDGVFAVRERDVLRYMEEFNPQPLRYNRSDRTAPANSINYGESKGLTFDRTIVFPHGPLKRYLASGNLEHAGREIEKLYVAATRARYSTAYVVPNNIGACILNIMYDH
ncbi:MAG: UvrD-helicase domain-containing protein [Thalassospira sp.]|nr:UvrD-helicase domain-containing protein [Thalassospira sp.]